MEKKILTVVAASALLMGSIHSQDNAYASEKMHAKKQNLPNFITIVIDDMGFSDFGAFGGEIPTPNFDKLANDGIMLTEFYAAPTSSPSRAMLFTGKDNHAVGLSSMGGSKMSLDFPSFPKLISEYGDYHTMMVGKWHLGDDPEHYPYARGFKDSYILLSGGDVQYLSDAEGKNITSWPPDKIAELGRKTYYNEDGVELREFPPNAYSTDLYTDKAIEMLDKAPQGHPFYLNLSYTAVHSPWQAPQEVTAKYLDCYAKGWDVLHQERFEKQKKLGLIKEDVTIPSRPSELRAWNDLTSEEQKLEAKRMAVYAAMIDVLDTNVGKLIKHLKEKGLYENTVIFVYSDNGAAGTVPHVTEPGEHETDFVIANFITDFPGDNEDMYEKMGDADTFSTADIKEWGWLSSTPFNGLKGSTYEGGIHTMGFMHYPKSNIKGVKQDCIVSVRDISGTILDMANVEYPKEFNDKSIPHSPYHYSLASFFDNPECKREDRPLGFGIQVGPTNTMGLRKGDWKLSMNKAPGDKWKTEMELYNVKNDPFEQNDLSKKNPEKYQELLKDVVAYLDKNDLSQPEEHWGSKEKKE